MFGLSIIGIAHTVIALLALMSGVGALVQRGEIRWTCKLGRTYLALTTLAALTALLIYRRGGFGPGHVLAVLTLVAVALGSAAGRLGLPAAFADALRVVCFSSTFLFHLIPGIAETLTRVPTASPFAATPASPELKPVFLAVAVVCLVLIALQVWRLRRVSHAA